MIKRVQYMFSQLRELNKKVINAKQLNHIDDLQTAIQEHHPMK